MIDPDVPKLQDMRRQLAQGVKDGEMKPADALLFLQGYADSLSGHRRRTERRNPTHVRYQQRRRAE